MANLNIPAEERNLNPALIQVLSGQFAFFAVLLLVWTGQDLQYSPGWVHPMFYYNVLTGVVAVVFGIYGTYLRRGRVHEY